MKKTRNSDIAYKLDGIRDYALPIIVIIATIS